MLRPCTRSGISALARPQHCHLSILSPDFRNFSSKTSKVDDNSGHNGKIPQHKAYKKSNDEGRQRKPSYKSRIREMETHLNGLQQEISNLPSLPDIFTASLRKPLSRNVSSTNVSHEYDEINRRAQGFIDRLQLVAEHQAQDRRFSREISELLQRSLCFFLTSFSDCKRIIALAKKYNLNIIDLSPAIEAACREEKWEEAADLFNSQIDPDVSGFTPMLIDLDRPLGLYAIAKDAQQRELPIAELVMDAVMKMSMVNPTDQERYVLAAGVALGYVGAWRALIEYQASSFNSARLGQALIGAAMYASLLSGEKAEALGLYRKVADGPGSEWQWSGGSEALDPIVRDIAMRSGSPEAFHLYRKAKEEGFQVSLQALISVIEECENVSDIVPIIDDICCDTSWVVDGDKLEIVQYQENNDAPQLPREQLELLALKVARKVNLAGEFGLSMLCYEMLLSNNQQNSNWYAETSEWLRNSEASDVNLSIIMTALYGLEASHSARALYEVVSEKSDYEYPLSSGLYHFVNSNEARDNWPEFHQNIRLLVGLTAGLPKNTLTSSQTELILIALAKVMRTFNNAQHPRAALFLSRQIQIKIKSLLKKRLSVTSMMHSFLNVEEDERPNYALLAMSDELLAETVRANRFLNLSDQGLSLFHETMKQESKLKYDSIPLAVNQVLETLIGVKQQDVAFKLFQSLDESAWTPEMFVTLGQALETENEWEMIGQLYRQSLRCGCLTEEMGLIALKAINEIPNLENKIRILRQIVREICRVTGQVDNEWLYDKYWELRKNLGRRYSRLLMSWNDPATSDLHELQLAIEQFLERKREGLRPRDDALRTILNHSRHYQGFSKLIKEKGMNLPVEKRVWKDLVLHVASEAQNFTLRDDSEFIICLVAVLRRLDENTKADEFLSEAILRGVQVDRNIDISP